MEPATLAVAAASLLAQRAAEALAGEAGKSAWSGLQHLWQMVRRRFANRPESAKLDAVEQDPTNREAVTAIAASLLSDFDQDERFRAEVAALVRDAQTHYSVREVTNNFYGEAHIGKLTIVRDVHGDVRF